MDASPALPVVFDLWGSLFLVLWIAAVNGADWVERAARQRVALVRWVRRGRDPRIGVEANVAGMKLVLFATAAVSYAVVVLWIVQAIRGELH